MSPVVCANSFSQTKRIHAIHVVIYSLIYLNVGLRHVAYGCGVEMWSKDKLTLITGHYQAAKEKGSFEKCCEQCWKVTHVVVCRHRCRSRGRPSGSRVRSRGRT